MPHKHSFSGDPAPPRKGHRAAESLLRKPEARAPGHMATAWSDSESVRE